jgi:cyclin-dependent kinase-like
VLKICDFGFARSLLDQEKAEYTDYVSTRWYRAPELLVGDVQYGPEVDIWAAGCLFAEIFNGMPLFAGESDLDTLQLILKLRGNHLTGKQKLSFFNNGLYQGVIMPRSKTHEPIEEKLKELGPTALNLLTTTLDINPELRINANECLLHPFFTSFKEKFQTHF